MPFNRPPRIRSTFDRQKIELPAPPTLPNRPKINWLTVGLPIVAIGLSVGLMIWLIGPTSGLSLLVFLPLMLASVLASVINHKMQIKEYDQSVVRTTNAYRDTLWAKRDELQHLVNERRAGLMEVHPGTDGCLQRAIDKDIRLGERRPNDDDFLTIRLGLGKPSSGIEIKPPPEDNRDTRFKDLFDEADGYVKDYKILPESPVTTCLMTVGVLGVAGNSSDIHRFARAALVHLSTHHWPAEVNVAVFSSASPGTDWDWLEELPHRSRLFTHPVVNMQVLAKSDDDNVVILERELRRRQTYYSSASAPNVPSAQKPDVPLPVLVIVLDQIHDLYEYAAFALLLKEGPRLGVFGICLAQHFDDLPGECGATVEMRGSVLDYKETGIGRKPLHGIKTDNPGVTEAGAFAQALASIDWLVPAQVTEPPSELSLLEMLGKRSIEELPLETWWDEEYRFGYLRAPIGRFSPFVDLIFDLNDTDESHGPHGLIGGTTGSGKSELLKTIILALSLTHHPYDVNFALIDYKGGGAFKGLEILPHVVGVITDIENHADYATRVIMALSGEINTRKQILEEARQRTGLTRSHIDDYRGLKVKRPLPRLVIIFDEYAEFKDQHPNESQKLINIARQGRSLGVHLILCTQNPASGKVIDDQIRQNTKFRICLRVNSADDSRSLIGIPDAMGLSTGEAFLHLKQPQRFRVAYTGAVYAGDAGKVLPEEAIVRIHRDGSREVIYPPGLHTALDKSATELTAITRRIVETARALNLGRPPKVWPEPLSERVHLPSLIEEHGIATRWDGNTWTSAPLAVRSQILGIYDDPAHQRQPLYVLGSEGSGNHLLAVGGSGSGKTTLLTTVAVGVALMHSPAQAHIYCLDLSSQNSLKVLESLPHLPAEGGVITATDRERIDRLFSMLRTFVRERAAHPGHTVSPDTGGQDGRAGEVKLWPSVFLLIDNLSEQFIAETPGFAEQLAEIVRAGRSADIHVLITANLVRDVPTRVFAEIQERVAFLQTESSQIDVIVGRPPDQFTKMRTGELPPPGRGLRNGNPVLEFHTALPVEGADDGEQRANLNRQIERMHVAWPSHRRPPDVGRLALHVTSQDLFPKSDSAGDNNYLILSLGLSHETLQPIGLSIARDGPTFLVASVTPKLGKTAILQTFLLTIAQHYCPGTSLREEGKVSAPNLKGRHSPPGAFPPRAEFVLIDFHSRTLRHLARLPHATCVVGVKNDLSRTIERLEKEIQARQKTLDEAYAADPMGFDEESILGSMSSIVIVIDDYDAFRTRSSDMMDRLAKCIASGEELGVRLVVTENIALLGPASSEPVLRRVARNGCGILLGGSENMEAYFNNAKVPYGQKTTNLPPGRGYLINRGHVELFQAAVYWKHDSDPDESRMARVDELMVPREHCR